MKKTIKVAVIFLNIILLVGCLGKLGPSERVEALLDKYIRNDPSIISELNTYMDKQDLNDNQKALYLKIIEDEYGSIKYEIINETTIEDKATVEVTITVKDLYGASEKAESALLDDPESFYTDGVYDASKFIDYKLGVMENYQDTVNYTIYFNLMKKDGMWEVDDIDEDTLEKMHGIYNYNQ